MTFEIGDDMIDSREIIERIEELGEELADKLNDVTKTENWNSENLSEGNYQFMVNSLPESDKDDIEEYWMLVALAEECEQYSSDWEYGVTFIHEDYFTEYTEELCKEIGDISQELPEYIADHIDWEGVAEDLKSDYTEYTLDGHTYFCR